MRRLLLLAAVALLVSQPAYPQGQPTGTLTGKIVDAQGLALPGASVSVTSPRLQGSRAAVTSANGDYIIPFLPAGEYSIAVELSGFKTVKLARRVALGETIALPVTLEVSAVTEVVTVTAEAPADFTRTAQITTAYKAELLEKLPTQRTLLGAVDLAPGVHATGPSGNRTISGAVSFENVFLINGVVAQDNIRNTPFNLFIEDAIQETEVRTGSISAEFGRFSGGVVNLVTKSGGNEFTGSFRTTFENDKWVALTPFANDSRVSDVTPTYEATLGGPIVKDKLWFFGAGRFTKPANARTTASFTNIPFKQIADEKRYEGKLTYSLTTKHSFKGAYLRIDRDEEGNTFPNPGGILDLESLVSRSLPQRLYSFNYTGILSSKFFVEAQYSRRRFTFENAGARSTDLVAGTLLLDRQRNNLRYHSPTFCGVCTPEGRDNHSVFAKASYFLSTPGFGSHNLVFGVDAFNDQRSANNHQSGSDYRILGTTSIIQGTNVFPVFNNDRSTIIQWNPIFEETQGNNFRTYSGFINDQWRLGGRFLFNVGVRYDKNDGKDSLGKPVVKDSAFSPRLAMTFEPRANGNWTINAGYAKYVAAVANSVGDSQSAGGQPANFQFDYLGPAINTDPNGPLAGQDDAIRQVFDWFQANGGTDRPTRGAPTIPGVTGVVSDRLKSPNVVETTVGVTRRLGTRGLVRLDGKYRDYRDFYSDRVDLTTGRVTDPRGRVFDRDITENTDKLKRRYKELSAQAQYRVTDRWLVAGNYTLSHAYGNLVGETIGGGPGQSNNDAYPEYKEARWNYPEGDLSVDQRHRARLWTTYDVPIPKRAGSLNVGVLGQIASGTPYNANGVIDTRPYVTNPGYVNPPATVTYFFSARDAFHTDATTRVDLALGYAHRLGVGQRSELFVRGTIDNVFNAQGLDDITFVDTSVLTRNTTASLQPFNPFTSAPVEGVHWQKGPQFGKATSRLAYQTPRTYRFSLGVRF